MILVTDLDRTLLPNGKDEYDNTLPLFFNLIKNKEITLVYATGRNLELFEKAQKEFKIKNPDYLIGEVGTVIYKKIIKSGIFFTKKKKEKMVLEKEWFRYLHQNSSHWNFGSIKRSLEHLVLLELQEQEKLNNYKISYYLKNLDKKTEIIGEIEKELSELKIEANIIYSIDPIKNVGLVDILPKIATKTLSLEFLRKHLGKAKEEIVYCGDSGNDITALTFGYKSILVKNAREEIKETALKESSRLNYSNKLYIAKGTSKLNGNYVSGIIEGLIHFGIIDEKDIPLK